VIVDDDDGQLRRREIGILESAHESTMVLGR
jgi:hypothetical protein